MRAAVLAALALSGCCAGWPQPPRDETPPPVRREGEPEPSPWVRSESVDDLTRRPISTMEVGGLSGTDRARLVVSEHPRDGTSVYVVVDGDRVQCFVDCRIEAAFDGAAPTRWTGAPDDAGIGDTVFVRRADAFERRLRSARTVRIEVPIVGRGRLTYLFPGLAEN